MSIFNNRVFSTRGSTLYRAGKPVAQLDNITGLDSGGKNEIDVTGLHSVGRETILGFADSGTVSGTGTLVPQSDSHAAIEGDKRDNNSEPYHVLMPAHSDDDTGVGLLTPYELGNYEASLSAAAAGAEATITAKKANEWKTLPAFGVGDYIKIVANQYARVKSVEIDAAGKLVLKVVSTAVIAINANLDAVMLRPPVRYGFTAQVSTFSKDLASEDAGRFNLELRVSGAIIIEVGTPSLLAL